MSNAILGAAVIVLALALVAIVYIEARALRDESTANRMERADLLQRIQAPQLAVAEHSYTRVPQEPAAPVDDVDELWEKSDESLVPFDEDLLDLE